MRKGLLIAAVAATLALAPPAGAATLEQIGSFESPVFVTSDPGDPNRLFVVEQEGRIVLSQGGGTSTFTDLSPLVLSGGEQGLLSMAFAPDFASSGRFYVYYTSNDGDIQVDELTASGSTADPATRRPVITVPHPSFGNHNGGQLQIGPDGMLYMATGDGGGGGDPDGNAQDLNSLLGKVLRIDPRPSSGGSYSIPPGNPFAGRSDTQDEIWSYGLRNPYRFSFDRLTGAIAIGDVGQGSWEEVDYVPGPNAGRGANFGWDCREGAHDFADADPVCGSRGGFTDPVFEYENGGANCAITGGYVVRDQSLGDLYGRYLYADFCAGEIRSLVPGVPSASGDRSEGLSVESPSSFGEDSCGRVYVTSLQGPVYRFVGAAPPSCAGPGITLSARRRQDVDRRIRLKVKSDEPASAVARARLVTREKGKGKRAARAKVARLPRWTDTVAPGDPAKVKWNLSRKKTRTVRRKLRRDKVVARFTVRASDAAGNLSREKDRSRIVR